MTTKEDEDVEEEDQEEKKTKSETNLNEALRKMAIDRREAVTARCLRRGMFSEYSYSSLKQRQRQQHTLKSSSSSSSKSYLHLAAKATEMTRTQKRINRGNYWEIDLDSVLHNESRAPLVRYSNRSDHLQSFAWYFKNLGVFFLFENPQKFCPLFPRLTATPLLRTNSFSFAAFGPSEKKTTKKKREPLLSDDDDDE